MVTQEQFLEVCTRVARFSILPIKDLLRGVFKSCQIALYPPQVKSKEVCSERCVEQ